VENDIPIAACYRKIKSLKNAGLLKSDNNDYSEFGKRTSRYASQLKKAYVYFVDGKMKLRVELSNDMMKYFE
jgi:hypothetical protein